MDEKDIWRAANQLLKQHGSDALRQAVAKQRGALDEEAGQVWSRIAAAVHSLQIAKADGPVN